MKKDCANIRIAFFDVDGTLLELGHKTISEKTEMALKQLQEKGVLLCMATGRGVLTMPRLEGICFDAYLTFNGSFCFNEKEILFSNPIKYEDILQILENTKAMGRAMAISNERLLVTNGTDPDLEQYFAFGNEKVIIDPDFEQKLSEPIFQIMLSCREEEYDRILQGTTETKAAAWWDRAADFIPVDGGKGIAIQHILSRYGLTKEQAIAFGDGKNDMDMLQAVGTGVAMGNALECVKAVADEICKPVNEDGIYDFCKEHGLIPG